MTAVVVAVPVAVMTAEVVAVPVAVMTAVAVAVMMEVGINEGQNYIIVKSKLKYTQSFKNQPLVNQYKHYHFTFDVRFCINN